MAQSLNRVLLIGRLGKDPVERDNGKVATFSMAMTDSWIDRTSGERQENTTWMQIVVFNQALAETTIRYLKKCALVAVEGSLANREYTDRDGVNRAITEIVIRPFRGDITFLDAKPDEPTATRKRGAQAQPGPR